MFGFSTKAIATVAIGCVLGQIVREQLAARFGI